MMLATGKVTRQEAEASVVEDPTAPMVDTSESVQYEVFLSNFPRLVEAVRPVVVKFAVNALSKSLISEYNKCQAENPTKEEYDRASVLMSQILPKIKENDAHFDAFVGILEELKITVLTANRTRGDSDSKSTSGTESVDATGFQCPCGHCSLEKYFRDRSKCPGLQKTSFPYLDISDLSRDERKTLEHRLIADTTRIKKEFKKLSDAVFKALKGTKTHISEIIGTVFSSAKAGSSKTIQTLHGDKLETITTISDLKSFLIRHDYISFFNYGILEALIEEYDDCKECQTDLDRYLQKFEDFSRRNVFEVPSDVFASSSSLDNLLVVKVIDEKWFGADRDTPDCPFTMWDITSIQNKIVEVIGPGHDRGFIDLVDVGKGCLQLAFEILSCQDTPIFPLTTSQLSELIRCGIIVLYQPNVPINMQDTDYQTHDIQSTDAEDTKTPPTVPSTDDSETPPVPSTHRETPPVPSTDDSETPPTVPSTDDSETPPVPSTHSETPPTIPSTDDSKTPPAVPSTNDSETPPVPSTEDSKTPPAVPSTDSKTPPTVPSTDDSKTTPVPSTDDSETPPVLSADDSETPPVNEAPVFLKNFRLMVDEVPGVLNSLDGLCRSFCSTVDNILTDFNGMKKAGIKLESKSRSVFYDIKALAANALLYVELVNNLIWFGQDEVIRGDVEQGIDSNDFKPLSEYISQLQRCLVQIGGSCEILTASCKEASKSSVDAAETCKSLAEQQRMRKNATQVVGGTVTAAVSTGGSILTALGLALAPFTAGKSAAVGMVIAAGSVGATTVVAGVTSAVVTHLIAFDFKKLEKEFRDLGVVFNERANDADSINDIAEGLNLKVILVSSCLDSVEHSWKNHETVVCLKSSLQLLQKRFSDLHGHSISCRDTVYEKQQQLESLFETLCSTSQ